jgi:hypothetical protein
MDTFWIYFAYFAGAMVKLAEKLGTYLYNAKKFNSTIKKSLWDWFFEKSAENGVSWGGTIIVVWVIGYLFIEQAVDFPGIVGAAVAKVPVAVPVACAVGYFAEACVPEIGKRITARIIAKFGGNS